MIPGAIRWFTVIFESGGPNFASAAKTAVLESGLNPEVQILGQVRLGVLHYRVAAHDRMPGAGVV